MSTCSLGTTPHANIVISLGFVEGKLLIADSQMDTTIKNLKSTKKACVVVKDGKEY